MRERMALVFPGQGSQTVGMGADVASVSPAARRVFGQADGALGFALSALCFHGPEDALKETVNAQPAIVSVSLALLAALEEYLAEHGAASPLRPAYVAGHSVGEYAALMAGGVLETAEALAVVRERGRLMHEAGQRCPGGMAAVLGLEEVALQEVCAQATQETLAALEPTPDAPSGLGQVVVANYNSPGQLVLSGERRALERAMELASARGAKRVVPLAVSGAVHSPVMQPAAAGLAAVLKQTHFHAATIPVISNISAQPLHERTAFAQELAQQVVSAVQWTRTVAFLVEVGVSLFVEIGAGQVLSGLIKRMAKGATIFSVSSAADVERVGAELLARAVE
jgi:[acyl-carrier-protein] S-malonyltransferase